jgi:hypothetical protein
MILVGWEMRRTVTSFHSKPMRNEQFIGDLLRTSSPIRQVAIVVSKNIGQHQMEVCE